MNRFLKWLDAWWPLVWKATYQKECQYFDSLHSQNWEHLDKITELLEEKSELVLKIRELEEAAERNAKSVKDMEEQIKTDLDFYHHQRAAWMLESSKKDETIKSLRKFAQSVRFAFNLMTNPEQPTGSFDACTVAKAQPENPDRGQHHLNGRPD